jgi:hypothetical protein
LIISNKFSILISVFAFQVFFRSIASKIFLSSTIFYVYKLRKSNMAASIFNKLFGKGGSKKKSAESEPDEDEFQTVKLSPSSDKTLKFIPGQFILLSGKDRGKPFRVAGFPTPEGSIITIGRDPVEGERAYAHIQLAVQTVSRKHAELNFRSGKLYIKNLSDTNPIEVNDEEIKVNEEVLLPLDSEIRLGEIRMKYILR